MCGKNFINLCKNLVARGDNIYKRGIPENLIRELKEVCTKFNIDKVSGKVTFLETFKVNINNQVDEIVINMVINISPIWPIYWVDYDLTGCIHNRFLLDKYLFEKLCFDYSLEESYLKQFVVKKSIIDRICKKYGYSEISRHKVYDRIRLYPDELKMDAIDKLGGQAVLARILEFGIEYDDTIYGQRKLSLDIDPALAKLANDVVDLSRDTFENNGVIYIGSSRPCKNHKEIINLIDEQSRLRGGKRVFESQFAYIWDFGRGKAIEGNLEIELSFQFYLSKYINSYCIVPKQVVTIHDENLCGVLEAYTVSDDMLVITNTADSFYLWGLEEVLSGMRYFRLDNAPYKVLINKKDVCNDVYVRGEVEIGKIIFGFTNELTSSKIKIEYQ